MALFFCHNEQDEMTPTEDDGHRFKLLTLDFKYDKCSAIRGEYDASLNRFP